MGGRPKRYPEWIGHNKRWRVLYLNNDIQMHEDGRIVQLSTGDLLGHRDNLKTKEVNFTE